MKISCIIPTSDRPDYLLEAIASIVSQSYQPIEIIVVNNGQAEFTLPPVLEQAAKIYHIMPYAGVAQARNFGAIMARGNYLAFLDDDDLWNQDYLKNVSLALSEGNECVVSRLDVLRNNKSFPYKNATGKLTINKLLISNPGVTGSNIVISKKLFFKVGGFNPRLPTSEDKALIMEVLLRQAKVIVLSENVAFVREHQGGRLSNPSKLADGIYFFIQKYSKLMDRRTKIVNWQKMYYNRYLRGEKMFFLPYIALALINKLFLTR